MSTVLGMNKQAVGQLVAQLQDSGHLDADPPTSLTPRRGTSRWTAGRAETSGRPLPVGTTPLPTGLAVREVGMVDLPSNPPFHGDRSDAVTGSTMSTPSADGRNVRSREADVVGTSGRDMPTLADDACPVCLHASQARSQGGVGGPDPADCRLPRVVQASVPLPLTIRQGRRPPPAREVESSDVVCEAAVTT